MIICCSFCKNNDNFQLCNKCLISYRESIFSYEKFSKEQHKKLKKNISNYTLRVSEISTKITLLISNSKLKDQIVQHKNKLENITKYKQYLINTMNSRRSYLQNARDNLDFINKKNSQTQTKEIKINIPQLSSLQIEKAIDFLSINKNFNSTKYFEINEYIIPRYSIRDGIKINTANKYQGANENSTKLHQDQEYLGNNIQNQYANNDFIEIKSDLPSSNVHNVENYYEVSPFKSVVFKPFVERDSLEFFMYLYKLMFLIKQIAFHFKIILPFNMDESRLMLQSRNTGRVYYLYKRNHYDKSNFNRQQKDETYNIFPNIFNNSGNHSKDSNELESKEIPLGFFLLDFNIHYLKHNTIKKPISIKDENEEYLYTQTSYFKNFSTGNFLSLLYLLDLQLEDKEASKLEFKKVASSVEAIEYEKIDDGFVIIENHLNKN